MSCSCHHCRHKRTDSRDGAGRKDRLLQALDPKQAPLDDRKIEDLLAQVKSYASKVRFFPLPEEEDGSIVSWQTILERDMSMVLASVVLSDPSEQEALYNRLRSRLYADPTNENLALLFGPINVLRLQIEHWYAHITPDNPLYADLLLLTQSSLRLQLRKAISIAKALGNPANLPELEITKDSIWDFDSSDIKSQSFPSLQTPDAEGLSEEEVDPLIEISFYIDDVFQAFYQTTVDLISKSHEHLDFSLQQYPEHQPHLALLITFLELFKHLQDDMNDITRRHLDFFYRDVLHLSERPAIPDQVHVIFELAKGVNHYVVDFGMQLPAGEEPISGKEIVYKTGENDTPEAVPFVPNRTVVREIKNVYLELDKETKTKLIDFHSNPIANSADGNGAAFPKPGASFDTFGVEGRDEETSLTLCNFMQQTGRFLNKGRIGFAIATPQLLLGGGVRTIELKVKGLKDILLAADLDQIGRILEIWLSSEKGWMQMRYLKTPMQTDVLFFTILADQTLQISLPIGAPKIIPFDPALHPGDSFPTQSPVMKVILRNLDKDHFTTVPTYDQLVIDPSFSLDTIVGNATLPQNGLKDLVVQNSMQSVENGKTFFAFTQLPGNGFPLYVGSPEFFSKSSNIAGDFKVHIQWASSIATPKLHLDLLKNKEWTAAATDVNAATVQTTTFTGTVIPKRSFGLIKEDIDADTENGFFRITPLDMVLADIEARAAEGILLQAEYISVEYTSILPYADLKPGVDQFFHLYPFGFTPIFPAKNFGEVLDMQSLSEGLSVDAQVPGTELNPQHYLFPQFRFGAPADRVLLPNESQQYNQATLQTGQLIIGLQHLAPPQNVSLLFKFEEGTQADDDGTSPAVHWSYLINNEWRPLPGDAILNDGTFGLQTTGIILFSMPKDISSGNTLLPAGQFWLCASVSENPDRFPRLINIHAQAVAATFDDQKHDASHYETAYPAGSISNLKVPVDAVKSVAQPYESFGGRAADSGITFYTEASERIRHKGRANTIWDYEHMILSRFPSVFKVKAIPVSDPDCNCRKPQTNPCRTNTEKEGCDEACGDQIAPGHVMVVPVPDFQRRVGGNRLQPKNSNRVLQEIEDYLAHRISPFVSVHAKNPKYEEVLVSFIVQFREGIDKGVFLDRLNKELVQYLTPWAFEKSADVRFDGRVYASDVINFIEERPYVDFIVDFRMFHCKDDCCGAEDQILKEVKGEITTDDNNPLADTTPALIQILGTTFQITTDENKKFRILLADGDRILIKKEQFGTRIFRYDKKINRLIDEMDDTEAPFQDDAVGNSITLTMVPVIDFLPVVKNGFTNENLNAGLIKFQFENGGSVVNPVPLNAVVKISSPGFVEKQVIVGKVLASLKLFPQQLDTLKFTITGKTTQDKIANATLTDVQNNGKSGVKTGEAGEYEFSALEVGHLIVVSAEGYLPRVVAITEDLIEGMGAANQPPLEVSLLPDCQHRLGNTDEMIEFWEKVMSEYYPDARGIQVGIRPCSPQSILVSAAQHLISLYEPRPELDACAPVRAKPATVTPLTQPGTTGPYTLSNIQSYHLPTALPQSVAQFYHLDRNLQSIPYIFHSWGIADLAHVLGLQYVINPNLYVSNAHLTTITDATTVAVQPFNFDRLQFPRLSFAKDRRI